MGNTEQLHCKIHPPELDHGEYLHQGRFYRNLNRDDTALQYRDIEAYGLRLKISTIQRWNWNDPVTSTLSLSVNEMSCVGCPKCSIDSAKKPNRYVHVWEIDLELFNRQLRGGDTWAARYSPVESDEYTNKCHFCLVSLDGRLTKSEIIRVIDYLEKQIPPVNSPPGRSRPPYGQEEEAVRAVTAYCKVIQLHANVSTIPD